MTTIIQVYTIANHMFGTNPGVAFTPAVGNWRQDAVCIGIAPTSEVKVVMVWIPGSGAGVYQTLRPNSPLKCKQRLGTAPTFAAYTPEGLTDGNFIVYYGTEEDDILSYYAPNATIADYTWSDINHTVDGVERYLAVPGFMSAVGELNYRWVIEETAGANAAEWEIWGVQLEATTGPVIQSETLIIDSSVANGGGCALNSHVVEEGRLPYYPVYKLVFTQTGQGGPTSSGHIRIGP